MRLSSAVKRLSEAGIDEARLEARILFSRIGKAPECELLFDPECDSAELDSAIEARARRIPLAYILGEADFYRENYVVTPDCLIPRPETELLVDYAVNHIPCGARFADICTGSGCIAISTLKNTEGTVAVALDLSEAALKVARANAKRNSVSGRIEFIHGDALLGIEGEFFAILSNPPYVSEAAYAALEAEIYEEPKMAFVGGVDGGDFYREMIPLYKNNLQSGGFLAFEIGYDQGELLRSLGASHGMETEIIKDYSGLDRIAVLKKQ